MIKAINFSMRAEPALRNFDLALVKKSLQGNASASSPIVKGKHPKGHSQGKKKGQQKVTKRKSQVDESDKEDTIGTKNLEHFLAQIFSIPTEHLERLEKRFDEEGVLHVRGLSNVQWPPLLNFGALLFPLETIMKHVLTGSPLLMTARENPEEFQRTGGWAEYLKPTRGHGSPLPKRGRGSAGCIMDEEEESDGEFMPASLDPSYSDFEIDEADDAEAHARRKRRRLEKRDVSRRSKRKSQRGEDSSDEGGGKRKRPRPKEGLAALLHEVSDEYDTLVMPGKKRTRKEPPRRNRGTSSRESHHKKLKQDKRATATPKKKALKRKNCRKVADSEDEQVADNEGDEEQKRQRKLKKTPRKRSNQRISADDAQRFASPKATEAKRPPNRRRAPSSSPAALTLSQKVLQRQFAGYRTRSKGGADLGQRDKIIRIDPPATRRRRKPNTGENQPTEDKKRSRVVSDVDADLGQEA